MTDDTWTVKRILEWIEGYLAQHGDENPRVSSQWLVSEALGVSRMQLFLDAERPLTSEERTVLRDWTRRRGAHEPLQYITGETAFRHITVKVRKGVLIPRPETEVLVSEALALLPAAPKPQDVHEDALLKYAAQMAKSQDEIDEETLQAAEQILEKASEANGDVQASQLLVADLCTGSGCIACSIAYEHPSARVIATDISPDAIALATENVTELGLDQRITVMECDLASGISPDLLGTFDLVVSNPPYVPTQVIDDIPEEVASFEPTLALDGGADGLDIYRRILTWCADALKPGGAFAIELHETTLDEAADQARNAGFTDVRIATDLATRPRILTAKKPA